jgi:aminoglycoside phosphotransferase (APT) family kinase protein
VKPPHDPEFPGFAAALDGRAVLDALRRTLPPPDADVRLLGITVMDVRYRPGGPCWVLYQVKLRAGGQRSSRQLLAGQVLRRGEAARPPSGAVLARYAALHADGAVTGLRTPVIALPDVPIVLHAFPLDAALPGLLDAVDPRAMRGHLARMWSPRRLRVRRITVHQLGYTPHARAALLYEVLSEAKSSGLPEVRRLVGKMHAKKPTARLFADQWAVWSAALGRINLAPPVGFVDTIGLTLQEQVHGQRLGGLVTAGGFRKWVGRTARMLAGLHGLSVPLSSRRLAGDEVETVARWAGVLTTIRSDLARRVDALRDQLMAHVAARTAPTGPIHADFHHTNVLVDGDDVTIIDLDEMAWGDPMVDVGRFLASLRVPARRAFGSIGALQDAGDTFLEEYLRQGSGDERRARLFEAASLFIAAGSAFRIQRPTWEQEVSELLDEAERVFALASRGIPLGGPAPDSRRPALPFVERLRWAADPVYAQAVLTPVVREAFGAELTECRVTAAAGGRGRLRYDLRGRLGAKPWRRRVEGIVQRHGGGRTLLARLDALRGALDGSPDAPDLPRSVGCVGRLALVLWEVPAGVRFPDLDGETALEAAERLARGLVALHGTSVELGEPARSLDAELHGLRARVARLGSRIPDAAGSAADLLASLERASRLVSERVGPALRTVDPRHVTYDGERVGVAQMENIGLAHPLLDAGDFLARVTLLGMTNRARWASAAAGRFRDAYRRAEAADGDGLAVFEAGALLRLACARRADDDQGMVRLLIAQAAERLAS